MSKHERERSYGRTEVPESGLTSSRRDSVVLASSEQRLALALEAGHMGTWEWEAASGRVAWSPALERVHGIPEGSFAGTFDAYQSDIFPEDRERVLETISRCLERGERHHLEYRIIRPDGAVRWLEASGQVLFGKSGKPTGMIGVCADVTERKLAEIAVKESEAWFSTTLASVGDAVVATDTAGNLRYMNASAEQLIGCTFESAKGRPLAELLRILNEHTREPVESPVQVVLQKGIVVGLANHSILVRPDGGEFAVDDSAAPIRDPSGAMVGVVMVFRDVSEERLEEARQAFIHEATRVFASSLDYEQAVASIAQLAVPGVADWCAVDVVESDGGIRRLAVAHIDPKKVELAHELHRRYPPDPNAAFGVPNVLRTGESQLVPEISDELLVRAARDEEHLRIVRQLGLRSYMVVPIRGAEKILGAVSFVTAEAKRAFTQTDLRLAEQLCDRAGIAMDHARLYRDVQEARRQAERALTERERLVAELTETVRLNEIFAGILGHDLRNPLGAILTAAQLLLRRTDDEQIRRPVQRIVSSGERMTRMIEQLLDFTRARVGGGLPIEAKRNDLGVLCGQILRELEDANPGRILRLQREGDTVGFWDPDRMGQLVSNLAGNACQHGEPQHPVLVRLDGSEQNFVTLSVSNKGEIRPDLVATLFDPFRAARDARDHEPGLGLGLFISQQIVLSHAGTIDVHSADGWTTFSVMLPRAAQGRH